MTEYILLCIGIIGLVMQFAFVAAELICAWCAWFDEYADAHRVFDVRPSTWGD